MIILIKVLISSVMIIAAFPIVCVGFIIRWAYEMLYSGWVYSGKFMDWTTEE